MTDLINKVWLSFLKNPDICNNETFRTFIPRIMEVSKSKLSRVKIDLTSHNVLDLNERC